MQSTGQMRRIGGAVGAVEVRISELRDVWKQEKEQRIAANHEQYGTPADANCELCGDTGIYLESKHACNCIAGKPFRDAEELHSKWMRLEIPSRFRDYRIGGATDVAAAAKVSAWVDTTNVAERRFPKGNLYLFGGVGTGKTGLAIGALRELSDKGVRSLRFYSVPDMLDQMRPGHDQAEDIMERCKGVAVLVLDDLGVEKPSDWVRERLYVLLNARYENERPTIVTTNCDLVGLQDSLGERTISRFVEEVTVVKVSGPDRRRA